MIKSYRHGLSYVQPPLPLMNELVLFTAVSVGHLQPLIRGALAIR